MVEHKMVQAGKWRREERKERGKTPKHCFPTHQIDFDESTSDPLPERRGPAKETGRWEHRPRWTHACRDIIAKDKKTKSKEKKTKWQAVKFCSNPSGMHRSKDLLAPSDWWWIASNPPYLHWSLTLPLLKPFLVPLLGSYESTALRAVEKQKTLDSVCPPRTRPFSFGKKYINSLFEAPPRIQSLMVLHSQYTVFGRIKKASTGSSPELGRIRW